MSMTTSLQTIVEHWAVERDLRMRVIRRRDQIGSHLGDEAQKYFEWECENSQPIVIGKINQLPEAQVERIMRMSREFEPKMCYRNAALVSMMAGFDYVEGYATNGILTYGHAWNAAGDIHFDVTDEIVLGGESKSFPTDPTYLQIVRVPTKTFTPLLLKTGVYGEAKATLFAQNVLGLKTKKAIKAFLKHFWIHMES